MDGQDFRNVPVYRGAVKVSMPSFPAKETSLLLEYICIFSCQACVFDWAGTVCDAGVFAPGLYNVFFSSSFLVWNFEFEIYSICDFLPVEN